MNITIPAIACGFKGWQVRSVGHFSSLCKFPTAFYFSACRLWAPWPNQLVNLCPVFGSFWAFSLACWLFLFTALNIIWCFFSGDLFSCFVWSQGEVSTCAGLHICMVAGNGKSDESEGFKRLCFLEEIVELCVDIGNQHGLYAR